MADGNILGSIGDVLTGFRADIAGRGEGFRAQRDLRRLQSGRALSKERKIAAAEDALAFVNAVQANDLQGADEFLTRRIGLINQLDGDPTHTINLQQKFRSGDIQGALADGLTVVESARDQKFLPQLAAPEEFTLSPGQRRFIGEREIAAVPVTPPKPPQERKVTEKERAEIAKIRAETTKITQEARGLPKAEAALLKEERTETIKKNVLRISDLSKGVRARTNSIRKASKFLRAFVKGQVTSGAGRAFLSSFIPGVFTSQAQFDEELDSFAEVAAREKLKAVGEIRPTDADVEGMKRALFGIGRDEKTNINLLQEFIDEQEGLDDELEALRESKRTGQLSTFTGLQNQPIEVDF